MFSLAELLQAEPSIDDGNDDDELVQVPLEWYLIMRELYELREKMERHLERLEKCTCGARNKNTEPQ